jgi:hypothetical protein
MGKEVNESALARKLRHFLDFSQDDVAVSSLWRNRSWWWRRAPN